MAGTSATVRGMPEGTRGSGVGDGGADRPDGSAGCGTGVARSACTIAATASTLRPVPEDFRTWIFRSRSAHVGQSTMCRPAFLASLRVGELGLAHHPREQLPVVEVADVRAPLDELEQPAVTSP